MLCCLSFSAFGADRIGRPPASQVVHLWPTVESASVEVVQPLEPVNAFVRIRASGHLGMVVILVSVRSFVVRTDVVHLFIQDVIKYSYTLFYSRYDLSI